MGIYNQLNRLVYIVVSYIGRSIIEDISLLGELDNPYIKTMLLDGFSSITELPSSIY